MPAAADAPFRLRCDHLDDPVGHPEARPRLSWLLPPSLVRQRAYEVATDDGQGTNRVESERAYLVDWPFEPLRSRQRVTWRVRAWGEGDAPTAWSEWAIVEAGLLQRSDWQGAFIGGALVGGPRTSPPTTLLRRTFAAPAGVERARLHIAALGLFVARLNGERVGDAHLAPGWTEYAKRVQAQTLEVDHLLRAGDNELVIELADSWYAGHVGWQHRQTYGERPWLLAQVEADGRVLAATDEAWQAAQDGPTLRADLLMGEEHDARRIPTDWRPAVACEGGRFDALAIAGSASAPVREQEVLEPREAHHLGDHFARQTWRLDFGQNLVGVPRLNFAALKDVLPPGADDFPGGVTLKLRFAEMLRDDGTLYVENLRSAEATDYYTSRGDEVSAGVAWQPQFTFHGFRYLELSGLPPLRDGAAPPTGFATAVVLHNEMEPTGRFECSDPRVNALQHCIRWGQKGNFMSIPTDCPQRDERLGWTGDIQVFAPTACFNRDVAGFLDKWLLDLRDAQSAEGAVPAVCPSVAMSGANPWHSDSADEPVQDGGPAWSDAAVVVPYAHFRSYADTRAIERMHEAMCRYVAFLRDRDSHGLIRRHALHAAWGGFGDWLALDGGSPGTGGRDGGTAKDLIGTAYFARCCALLAEMSDAIGRDAAEWRQLGDDVAAAFRREFATEGGRLASHTQTAYLLALAFDLLDEAQRPGAVAFLLDLLKRRGWKLATGFVGTPLLLPTLTRFGHVDKAYRVLLSDTYPGWLFTVSLGATTMWERWNSWTPTDGFGPVEMNSFNHYAYGAVGQWLYETVGGLSPVEPGYRVSRIAPQPGNPASGEGLTSAATSLLTPHGRLASAWRVEGGAFTLRAIVPPNTVARVRLPSGAEHDAGPGEHAWGEAFAYPAASAGG